MLKVTALIPGFSSTSPECSRLIPAGLAKNPLRTRIFPHLHQGMALGSTQITQIQGNLPQLLLQILWDPPNPGCSSRRAHPIPPREDKNNPKPPTHFGSQALLVIPRSRGSWGGREGGRSVGCPVCPRLGVTIPSGKTALGTPKLCQGSAVGGERVKMCPALVQKLNYCCSTRGKRPQLDPSLKITIFS